MSLPDPYCGLSVGDYVAKRGGDYVFEGWIMTIFSKRSGVLRCCVENAAGMVHVFNLKQLAREAEPSA